MILNLPSGVHGTWVGIELGCDCDYCVSGDEMVEETGMFLSKLQIEATAVVTHPPGTKFDEDGKPIPPEEDNDK